jgi:hypothetical protein
MPTNAETLADRLAAAQRREEAIGRRAEAQAREGAALSEVQAHLMEVRASISACALALQSALAAEARAGEAHRDAYRALLDLGEGEQALAVLPSLASELIERSTLLRAIRAGRGI